MNYIHAETPQLENDNNNDRKRSQETKQARTTLHTRTHHTHTHAPHTHTHTHTHTLSLTHSLTHSRTHARTHARTHPHTRFGKIIAYNTSMSRKNPTRTIKQEGRIGTESSSQVLEDIFVFKQQNQQSWSQQGTR